QRPLALFALSDVDDRADVAEEGARFIKARPAGINGPAVRAIRPAHAIIERERLALLVGFQEDAPGFFAVVGMDRVEPAKPVLPQGLMLGLAGELLPAARDEHATPVGFGYPEHGRGRVGHIAETRFAVAQSCFSP